MMRRNPRFQVFSKLHPSKICMYTVCLRCTEVDKTLNIQRNLETASVTNFLHKNADNFSFHFVWNSLAFLCPRYSMALSMARLLKLELKLSAIL